MSKQIKFILLWGLPGSGKTTFATNSGLKVVNLDSIAKTSKPCDFLTKVALNSLYAYGRNNSRVILDGLVTTNSNARDVFNAILIMSNTNEFKNRYEITFGIEYWLPDREACVHNNSGRRDLSSVVTIENIQYEYPSEELLKEFNINKKHVNSHKVYRKSAVKIAAEELGINIDTKGLLKSSFWSLGGTSGFSDTISVIHPDDPPLSFEYFDKLLEKMLPNISFFQYKRLYNATVKIEKYTENDYYGGSVTYANYVCDCNLLFKMIQELEQTE